MVEKLSHYGVIKSPSVRSGFSHVDRSLFVPPSLSGSAFSDEPLRHGPLHLSAPHIYATALDALDLPPDSALSFLNLGSGSGYLSAIASCILGPRALSHGVELDAGNLAFSQAALARLRASAGPEFCAARLPDITLVRGNALNVSELNLARCYDRIYLGASIRAADLPGVARLLAVGGVLVGPVEDELVRVRRVYAAEEEGVAPDAKARAGFCMGSRSAVLPSEFEQETLSGVRFAPLLREPALEPPLPNPTFSHVRPLRLFGKRYRQALMAAMLCHKADLVQPSGLRNNAAALPADCLYVIFSFCGRARKLNPNPFRLYPNHASLQRQLFLSPRSPQTSTLARRPRRRRGTSSACSGRSTAGGAGRRRARGRRTW
jgi:protein-L-isoaspartate O-methyltransferase